MTILARKIKPGIGLVKPGRHKEKNMLDWIKGRLKERTSWDGAILVAGCLSIIILGPLAKWAAWLGLGWGLWTIWKEESTS